MKIFSTVLFFLTISTSVYGQTVNPIPEVRRSDREVIKEPPPQPPNIDRRTKEFDRLDNESRRNNKAEFIKRESFPFKSEVSKQQRRLLKPDEQLAAKYSSFLKQPRTGLIKLFPDVGCENNLLILRADAACLNWIPNSAFYSFREQEHTSDFLSDVSYQDNAFVSNGILSHGILTLLGNIPLDAASLSTSGMKFLIDYKPALENNKVLSQFQEIRKIVKSGNHIYAKALPALVDVTYAARIIAYKGKYISPYKGRLYNVLDGDNRLDIIVVFRIASVNDDGSVSVLWKELSRQKSPTIKYVKKGESKKIETPR